MAEAASGTKVLVDVLVSPIGELATPDIESGCARGAQMGDVRKVKNAAVAIKDGKIVFAGPKDEVLKKVDADQADVIDASNQLVTPGLVDPHTHIIFGGNRHNEFAMRCQGKTYKEIAEQGGGIVASMRGTRDATQDELTRLGRQRLERMLQHGTTSCEVKTGYGLDRKSELSMLDAILSLDETQPVELTPTFLPAHAVPPGVKREVYVNEVVEDMLPAALALLTKRGVPASRLYVDVFCDEGYFTLEDTKRIFEKARELGMKLKVHSDEFASLGATSLACAMHAHSADHLLAVTEDDIGRLSKSDCVAVLLPGTSFFLNLSQHAPARTMIEKGVAVALGSDFNPGSCHIFSLPFIMGLACLKLKMTADEALTAMTINAAHAIGRGESIGQLRSGYQADMVLWNVSTLAEIPYNMGWNPVSKVLKKGALV
ncbi:MAG: imidazolonepropionase [Candidatus Obscuribacterales bacterium]|nr:imidazolonepropionase [Candidatus Obscuribacterales bacterium]